MESFKTNDKLMLQVEDSVVVDTPMLKYIIRLMMKVIYRETFARVDRGLVFQSLTCIRCMGCQKLSLCDTL